MSDGPIRTCIGCRERFPAAELVRVGLVEGDLILGRPPQGRSAWLCADPTCLAAAVKRRAFARALRCEVTAGQLDALRNRFPVG